jgi:hypothetical protein
VQASVFGFDTDALLSSSERSCPPLLLYSSTLLLYYAMKIKLTGHFIIADNIFFGLLYVYGSLLSCMMQLSLLLEESTKTFWAGMVQERY